MNSFKRRGLQAVLLALPVIAVGVWFGLDLAANKVERKLNTVSGSSSIEVSERARRLHAKLVIVDLHADSLLWNRDLLRRSAHGHVDVPRLIDANVALQTFAIVTKVPSELKMENNTDDTDDVTSLAIAQKWPVDSWYSLAPRVLHQARKLVQTAKRSNGQLTVIRTASDLQSYLERRKTDNKCTAGLLAIEGAHALDGNLENIDVFFDAGVRMMAPTHFFDNDLGGSAHGTSQNGLTEKGKEMIRRMQDKHMVVDLAHASPAVLTDALVISKAPVVVSHTGVKGTCNSVRNLSDDQLKGIAYTGGVVGIGYWPEAVGDSDIRSIARAMRHASAVAGIDHVALGSDFDGATTVPFDVTGLVQLTQALIDEGFTDEEIEKIFGANALRVFQTTLPEK
jgi:membrane dipeptidase